MPGGMWFKYMLQCLCQHPFSTELIHRPTVWVPTALWGLTNERSKQSSFRLAFVCIKYCSKQSGAQMLVSMTYLATMTAKGTNRSYVKKTK